MSGSFLDLDAMSELSDAIVMYLGFGFGAFVVGIVIGFLLIRMSVNRRSESLHAAAREGNLEGVLHLLKRDHIVVDATDSDGYTAFAIAANNAHVSVMRALLKAGADPHQKFKAKLKWGTVKMSIALAACEWNNAEMLEALLDAVVDVNTRDWWNETLLFYALNRFGDGMNDIFSTVVKLLVGRGADVNWRNFDDSTPLHIACSKTYPAMLPTIGWLLQVGADPNALDVKGQSPLHYVIKRYLVAHQWGDAEDREAAEIAKVLLENGAEAEAARDRDGFTPFLYAAGWSSTHPWALPETVQQMLECKLDVLPEYDE